MEEEGWSFLVGSPLLVVGGFPQGKDQPRVRLRPFSFAAPQRGHGTEGRWLRSSKAWRQRRHEQEGREHDPEDEVSEGQCHRSVGW
jgi:hypothetical protein